jgi:hypothetical protein
MTATPFGPSDDYFNRGKYDAMQGIFQKNLGRDARPRELEQISSKPDINIEKIEKITQRKAAAKEQRQQRLKERHPQPVAKKPAPKKK